MRKRAKKNKVNGALITAILCSVLILIVGASGYYWHVYSNVKKYANLIYPGTKIADIDMKGKTKEEAINILKAKYGDVVLKKKIIINANNKAYTIDYSKLNAKYDIEDVVEKAFSYGKNLKLFDQKKLINKGTSQNYQLKFSYDSAYVKQILDTIDKDVKVDPVNASISMVSGGVFKITPDVKGFKLQKDKLEKDITDKINGNLNGDININAAGDEVRAAITEEKLKTIDSKISTFTTNYATSTNERAHNIEQATKFINGKLLMPGEVFSFNEIVGERTSARGFEQAPIIVGNKVESGFGGGICQVSSTLYNAVLRTDINDFARAHHTLPSSYVPLGFDATVDYGNIDFKFKNILSFPIFVEGITSNRNLYFNIYANSSLASKSYNLKSDVYENIPATTKTEEDPTLPQGQTVVEQKAYNGYKVKVTRETVQNGSVIKTDTISNDFYQPVTGIIKKGTKK